jgi:hypothetical protein
MIKENKENVIESSNKNILNHQIDTVTFVKNMKEKQTKWLSEHPEVKIYEMDEILNMLK